MRTLAIPALFLLLSYSLWGQDTTTTPPEPTTEAAEVSDIVYPRGSATGDENSDTQPLTGMFDSGGSAIGMGISILGYLIILIGFLVAAWFLFKRGVFRKPFSKTEGKLEIKESKMLGNRQFLMVVEYEDNKILLGVGPGKIDYLTSLNTYREGFSDLEGKGRENFKIGE